MVLFGGVAGCLGYLGYAFVRDVTGLTLIGVFVLGVASVTFSQLFAHARDADIGATLAELGQHQVDGAVVAARLTDQQLGEFAPLPRSHGFSAATQREHRYGRIAAPHEAADSILNPGGTQPISVEFGAFERGARDVLARDE